MGHQELIYGDRSEANKTERFEQSMLPHMDAAYNLARWLARNDHDAQDIVQEAYLRAFRFFAGFRGGDGRSWLLRIVRNTFYSWLEKNRRDEAKMTAGEEGLDFASEAAAPDEVLAREADSASLHRAIEGLPVEFREALVMRELEGLSYKIIADIADVPLGTVMSRLARARRMLRQSLLNHFGTKE